MLTATSIAQNIAVLRSMDPTRTVTLRQQWMRDSNKRFRELQRDIRSAVEDLDVLGLRDAPRILTAPDPNRFIALRPEQRLTTFMQWLEEREKEGILEVVQRPTGPEPWTNTYVRSSYQRGLNDAHIKLRGAGIEPPLHVVRGVGGVTGAFYQPFHASRVQLLYQRVFTDLEGVTGAMNTKISRTMTQGMIEGVSPREMAKRMNADVKNIGMTRARTIARTETVHAHNLANINEYERLEGAVGETIFVEWDTAEDPLVRATHDARHGKVFKREHAVSLLGEPNCRCALLPYMESVHGPLAKGPRVAGMHAPARGVPSLVRAADIATRRAGARGAGAEEVRWSGLKNTKRDLPDAYSGLGIDSGLVEAGVSPQALAQSANQVGEELARLSNKYGKVKTSLDRNPVQGITFRKGKRITTPYNTCDAYYDPRMNTIDIASGLSKNSSIELGVGKAHRYDPDLMVYNFQVSNDFNTVFRHELSHHFWRSNSEMRAQFTKVSEKLSGGKAFNKQTKNWFEENVSHYASTNKEEAFAEAFSAYTSPVYESGVPGKSLPTDMEKFFERYLGG